MNLQMFDVTVIKSIDSVAGFNAATNYHFSTFDGYYWTIINSKHENASARVFLTENRMTGVKVIEKIFHSFSKIDQINISMNNNITFLDVVGVSCDSNIYINKTDNGYKVKIHRFGDKNDEKWFALGQEYEMFKFMFNSTF